MNNILFVFLIWVPLDGAVVGSVEAEYIKTVYPTEAECIARLDGDDRVFWNSKPGHRMLGTKQCTDGSFPTGVSIGQFSVTVDQIAPNQ
jgi:hypothetical protein